MYTPRKASVTVFTAVRGSGKTTLINQILTGQRGNARVTGPERGYLSCERRYPEGRRRNQGGR